MHHEIIKRVEVANIPDTIVNVRYHLLLTSVWG